VDVTEQTFEAEVLERSRELPVVVDFWAEWCGPCHMLAPVLEEAVAAREGEVALVKIDVDAEQELAQRYGVSGIPAVKAFRRGAVVSEFVGARPRQAVDTFLDGLTGPSESSRLLDELRELGARDGVVAAIESEDWESAFALLLDELDTADGDARDEVRQLMVALFGELGQEHPLVVRYRRRLATALY
jgi:putative thioredoxin